MIETFQWILFEIYFLAINLAWKFLGSEVKVVIVATCLVSSIATSNACINIANASVVSWSASFCPIQFLGPFYVTL